MHTGVLYVVSTPIGNLEDITLRALRVLRDVSVIAAEDTRRTRHLLTHFEIRTPLLSLHAHNEARRTPGLLARLKLGESVALVTDAGTPLVSDPGGTLVREATAEGVRVEPVPGASAVLAALVAAGVPTDRFRFVGFPPVRSKDRKSWLAEVGRSIETTVLFEAPHRLGRTLRDLAPHLGSRRVAVCRELTKVHEEIVWGSAAELSGRFDTARGEITIVIERGQMAEIEGSVPPSEAEIVSDFGHMTDFVGSRRARIAALARHHGLPARQVYAILERAKARTQES